MRVVCAGDSLGASGSCESEWECIEQLVVGVRGRGQGTGTCGAQGMGCRDSVCVNQLQEHLQEFCKLEIMSQFSEPMCNRAWMPGKMPKPIFK